MVTSLDTCRQHSTNRFTQVCSCLLGPFKRQTGFVWKCFRMDLSWTSLITVGNARARDVCSYMAPRRSYLNGSLQILNHICIHKHARFCWFMLPFQHEFEAERFYLFVDRVWMPQHKKQRNLFNKILWKTGTEIGTLSCCSLFNTM